MCIAMNRFKIVPGKEAEFEKVWRDRNLYLGAPNFEGFEVVL